MVNKTITGHTPPPPSQVEHQQHQHNNDYTEGAKSSKGDGRALPREVLDNGQGKSENTAEAATMDESGSGSNMEISTNDSTDRAGQTNRATTIRCIGSDEHILLQPPIIEATGKIATGATTPLLWKQNKLHRDKRLL
jgi:hypothetical protein